MTRDGDLTAKLIDGVIVKEIRNVVSENSVITELYRNDWETGEDSIIQATLLAFHPGITTAWDLHEKQKDHVICIKGILRLALYDNREESPTRKSINVLHLSEKRPQLVVIPPNIWHGFQNMSDDYSQIVNFFSQRFQHEGPDSWRLPADTDQIPYRFPSL